MKIYKIKKVYSIVYSLLFIGSGIAGIDIAVNGNYAGIFVIIASAIMIYIFYKPKYYFTVSSENLTRYTFQKEESCRWEWIYLITTEKNNTTGGYFTVIHWSRLKKPLLEEYLKKSNKCNKDVGKIFITSHVAGYTQLIKDVIEKAKDATVDETTAKLVR
jgi:hypothetical protein